MRTPDAEITPLPAGSLVVNDGEIQYSDALAALRRFEPHICYTRGEQFYPIDVGRYVKECSLWVKRPDQPAELLVPQGEISLEELVKPRLEPFGSIFFLKFIEPLDLIELTKYSINQAILKISSKVDLERFELGRGRLARVGYGSRFVDALFSLTLVWRGRVPGDTAAAAALTYQRLQSEEKRFTYYGRVVRENGWIVLQYWYFYPFNNWRSGFFGVNDHEGDWEMVCVYCCEEPKSSQVDKPLVERLVPQWVAYASHDFSGDDLRRRWDDPEVVKHGDHPVVYAGAGSHASYFTRGEYMAEIELPFLSPLVKLSDKIQNLWQNTLRQASQNPENVEFNIFRIPFVDYARGDGLTIGAGQDQEWQAIVLDEQTDWAMQYRGLWGLYAQDPISGENAPAGPVYNRNGSMRVSWVDPLAWAGLDKVPPPVLALPLLKSHQQQVIERNRELKVEIEQKSQLLQKMGLEAAALLNQAHLNSVYQQQETQIQQLSAELSDLRRELATNRERLQVFEGYREQLKNGDRGSLRGHIHRAHTPTVEEDYRFGVLVEVFAAINVGVLMVAIVLLILFARQYLLFGLAALIGALVFLEASFRRQLSRLINSLSIGLAIVSALVLLFEFFWQVVVAGVLIGGFFVIWENLKELRS